MSYQYFEYFDEDDIYYDDPITFTYNSDGIRTSKTVHGIEHKYYLDGSQITAEVWMQNGVEYLLYYLYDETGSPLGIQYRTGNYDAGTFDFFFFEKNLQGDIIGIYNSNGVKICTYKYDAWGACTTVTSSGITSLERSIATAYNPFRYRGYYYDVQTGYYYLQSRYYNPNWGRFINADGYVSTGSGLLGYNMFAYCNNNPVMYADPTGDFPWLIAIVVIVALPILLSSCSSQSSSAPREDISNANSLLDMSADELSSLNPNSYNCYGNGIGKQILTDPTGYQCGDSTEKTFQAVVNDLGADNVRRLDSIDSPISENEFRVAMKCGPTDYHFIRQLSDGTWYNKSGRTVGTYATLNDVTGDVWHAIFMYNGERVYGKGNPVYTDKTIYFAVKKWG